MKTFNLPDLGEGLPDGEINEWHVKEGDEIKVDAPLVAIETAKAVVEVPSPFTGKIAKLYGKVGDVILTGSPLVDFAVEGKTGSSTVAGEIKESNQILVEKPLGNLNGSGAKALPAVRALAKKMKIDLAHITPTGPNGTITFDDVKKASAGSKTPATTSNTTVRTQDADLYEPLRGVRRTMAAVMTKSHSEVVPVTLVDDANISAWHPEEDYSVRIILALIAACQQEPALNAWYDTQQSARRLFKEVHIGLAMDTDQGLFIPVIKNAQEKSPEELRQCINDLKKSVQERTIAPDDLKGATIILSNFGKFAGRYVTVVLVPPTVAILGVGTLREQPYVKEGQVQIGKIFPLSLTTDHRVVTGGETTRFLGHLIRELEKPE